jgi:hypothetical protein
MTPMKVLTGGEKGKAGSINYLLGSNQSKKSNSNK